MDIVMKDFKKQDWIKELIWTGLELRYGDHPDPAAESACQWEWEHIIQYGYEDCYLKAFWVFHVYAGSNGIAIFPVGAMASSVVCYCLHLTEIDPLCYGLHSARFVNDSLPKFQYHIESARFEEFKKRAEDMLLANKEDINFPLVKSSMLQDYRPMDYLCNQRTEKPIPDNLDDEIARYALRFPATMQLYENYVSRKKGASWSPTGIAPLDDILTPTCGLLVYQEQMFDILCAFSDYLPIEQNDLRLAIQRGDRKRMSLYKSDFPKHHQGLSQEEFDVVWRVLTSNPKAFLKAHAVSRVIAQYHYNC